jgi:hypothetical protein
MQYLPLPLLRTRLLESLLYLHSQPPLFNLFLGLVAKLPFRAIAPVFLSVYLLLGVTLAASVLLLLLRLGVSRPIALVTSLLFAISPTLILYGNWLFYSLPVAVLLCLAALLLHEFIRTGRTWFGFGFFLALALIGLTRSTYHLAWFLLVAASLTLAAPHLRKQAITAALVPLVLLAGVYAKNLIVFGRFSASSWLGMNLWGVVTSQLPRSEIEELTRAGRLSPVALVPRYSDVADYPAEYRAPSRLRAPALVQTRKRSRWANYNNITYLRVSDAYLRDALYIIAHRPAAFAKGLLKSWFAYFKSNTDYVLLEPNRARIALWNKLYDVVFYGRVPFDFSRTRWLKTASPRGHYLCLLLLLGLPAVLVCGVLLTLRGNLAPADRITIAFLCSTIVYVALVGNLLEAGENNRFRFETDPLSLVLAGLALTRVLRRTRIAV